MPAMYAGNRGYVCYEGLPYCCGVMVLGEASSGPSIAPAIHENSGNLSYKGLLLYTLTSRQHSERAALEKAGFAALSTFYNPNTGNTVTLYGKKINQPRSPKTTKKTATRRRARARTAR